MSEGMESATASNMGTSDSSAITSDRATTDRGLTADQQARMWKVPVSGKEIEVDEKELVSSYQLKKASDERFMQAAEMRKQSEQFISQLKDKSQAFALLEKMGHDPRALAEEFLLERMRESMADPKDLKLSKLERELAAEREEKLAAKAEQQRQQMERDVERHKQQLSKSIVDTLEKSDLPKNENTVKRMAYYMHRALGLGYEISPQEALESVRNDYLEEHKSLLGQLDGEKLAQLLGNDFVKKIRNWDVGRVKNFDRTAKAPTAQAQPRKKEVKKQSFSEVMADIKKGL